MDVTKAAFRESNRMALGRFSNETNLNLMSLCKNFPMLKTKAHPAAAIGSW